MGYWGFEPFQNDYALDEYGGYNTPDHLKGLIWQGIRRGEGHSVDVHEIIGMILRSFKVYNGICREEDEKAMVKAIASKTFIAETADAMSGETPMMIMSCATIDFEERKKMLEYAVNKLKGIIENNQCKAKFDNNGIWLDNPDDEEWQAYKKTYNMGRKIVNNNFEDVKCPMMLLPEHVAWLKKMEKASEKKVYIEKIRNRYKDGMTNIKIRDNETWQFDNETLRIIEINGENLHGASNAELGISEVNAKEFLTKHFPNGFIWNKARLISVDTKKPLEYDHGEEIQFKVDTVKAVAQYVPVYKTKIEYETAMNNKKKQEDKKEVQNDNRLKIICLDRAYKGNKIVAYRIKDEHGRINDVTPEQLKESIRGGVVNCLNMILTSDNRLVPKKINK